MHVPETRYAVAEDGTHLAYLTFGDGPVDLLWIHGFLGGLEVMWGNPLIQRFSEALASFARLIRYDLRGTGCPTDRYRCPTSRRRSVTWSRSSTTWARTRR